MIGGFFSYNYSAEALRVFLEEKLGIETFIAAYECLRQAQFEEEEGEEETVSTGAQLCMILSADQQRYFPAIMHIVHFDSACFDNANANVATQ